MCVCVCVAGSQKVSSYPNATADGYSLSGRGTLMGQIVVSTLATSGQATSTGECSEL